MHYNLATSLLVTITLVFGCAGPSEQLSDTGSEQQQVAAIDRGRYVLEIMGCNDCHTPDYMKKNTAVPEEDWLIGGKLGFRGPYGTAYPTNLRLLFNDISEKEWLTLARKMRKGSPMAWVMLPKTSEQDLLAIYQFMKYLGPKGVPAPDRLPPGVIPSSAYVDYPDPH